MINTATDDDNDTDWGWIGLAGLLGLLGLRRKDDNQKR
ncbi:WGxxGxxG family protein [Marinithermofilum abyssi]|nr:WGxxGxxG family protein [Marinithermofilum abyssi]